MRAVKPSAEDVIEWRGTAITEELVNQFRAGTDSRFTRGFPLTLATVFRHPEFDWLARLAVDMRELLHADQEYIYIAPIEVGDIPLMRTWVSDFRERKGKQFALVIVELTSDLICSDVKKMTAKTTFVVKTRHNE